MKIPPLLVFSNNTMFSALPTSIRRRIRFTFARLLLYLAVAYRHSSPDFTLPRSVHLPWVFTPTNSTLPPTHTHLVSPRRSWLLPVCSRSTPNTMSVSLGRVFPRDLVMVVKAVHLVPTPVAMDPQ